MLFPLRVLSVAALTMLAARAQDPPEPAPAPPPRGVTLIGEAPEGFEADALDAMRKIEAWRGAKFSADVTVEFVEPKEEYGKLAGWYEPSTKRLVVVKRGTERFQRGTLMHEIFHALQDQRFDLGALHEKGRSKDASRAIEALVEGEAMLAVAELLNYDFRQHAKLPEDGPLDEARFEKIFKYGTGQDFVRALRADGGWARVDEAFGRPPLATTQIYLPRRWFENDVLEIHTSHYFQEGEALLNDGIEGAYGLHLWLTRTPSLRPHALEVARSLRADRFYDVAPRGETVPTRRRWLLKFSDEDAAQRALEAVKESGAAHSFLARRDTTVDVALTLDPAQEAR